VPTPVADATNAPERIWDGGPWDFEEGADFEPGEWPELACELKAIAAMLGGQGSAAEIIIRNKNLSIKSKTFRWRYMHRSSGWRGVL
jgi:hypothetical protein